MCLDKQFNMQLKNLQEKPLAVMVREAEWKDTMAALNVDQTVIEIEDAKKKMDAIEECALNWKPIADFLNNYNETLQ